MSTDIFAEGNMTVSNYVKWETVGQSVSGVYVDKRLVDNDITGFKQEVYTLMQDNGETIDVYGKGKSDANSPAVLVGMRNRRLGDFVGIKFDKEIPPKQKGYHPAKVINVYFGGEKRPDVLLEFQGGADSVFPDETPQAPATPEMPPV